MYVAALFSTSFLMVNSCNLILSDGLEELACEFFKALFLFLRLSGEDNGVKNSNGGRMLLNDDRTVLSIKDLIYDLFSKFFDTSCSFCW